MATLIDSSVLIATERGQLNFDAIAAQEDVAISAVTAAELLHGVHRPRTPLQRHRRQAFVEVLMAQLPVIAFDLTVARVHASLGPICPTRLCRGRARSNYPGDRDRKRLRYRHARRTEFSENTGAEGKAIVSTQEWSTAGH